jgi:hypothetical protein
MKGRVHVEELSQQICPTIKDRPANNRNSTAPSPHQTPQAAEFATLLRQHLRRFFYHLSSHKIILVPLNLSDSADDRVLGQSSFTMTYPSAQNLRMLRNPSLEDEESRVVTGGGVSWHSPFRGCQSPFRYIYSGFSRDDGRISPLPNTSAPTIFSTSIRQ